MVEAPAALEPRTLAGVLARCARRHGVPGAQLAVHQDGRTVTAEFGEVEHGTGRPVTADTAFPVGSVTKAFTAAVVLALAAEGDLELDEPVGVHVPGLPAAAAAVTIGQLLSHTGGLPCGPAPEQVAGLSVRGYLRQAVRPDVMVLPPGGGFSYSNVGYVLLGEVVSGITGMSWAEAVTAVLLRPLGTSTDLIGAGFAGSGRPIASGHSRHRSTGRVRPVRQCLVTAEAAAGALALSAADLVTFGRLHIGDGIPDVLPAGHAARMREVVPGAVPFGLARGWGLGLAAFGETPYRWFGHDGNADGTDCHLRIEPAAGRVVALTAGIGAGSGMWAELTAELRGLGIPLDDGLPQGDAWPAAATDCVGTYRNGDLTYEVLPGGPYGLRFRVDGEDAEPLVLGADLTFYLRDDSSDRWTVGGRFVRENCRGPVNAVQVGGRIGRRCAEALI
ncbi:CubicO group peptidase (beta-lactamase class C family) [Actinoplanes teichomyceticus]|uniref:CubicO group peptidase (Beta-lactamase class C family) n=2 Tax=Actinoplanes teichomyceticus TaxID=1867 RepID=A0A561VCB9_ACTTI|nr:CubicO group peptidase (beta-lactamase class C family) [Actinoplanes teichomyceticus]GIF17208.1 serine hydrolase [Actinoplanes teichomyceticus]